MNYLNIHVLVSHSPSCLNRDDMNMQKSAVFGGVRRARVSSQCLKHWMRKSDAFRETLGPPSVRTLQIESLVDRFASELTDKYPREIVEKTIRAIASDGDAKAAKPKKKRAAKDDAGIADDAGASDGDASKKKVAVAPWSVAEVALLCEVMSKEGEKALQGKVSKKDPERTLLGAAAQAADIALFGRMSTTDLMLPVDGACAIAHAITTHEADADVDWFTAVDDLRAESGEAGAGHLNTQEFGAGVFYRYASLNLKQLTTNLGESEIGPALKIAGDLVSLLATVVPGGKQQSFAAHNVGDYVLCVCSDMPISLANAFEKPVSAQHGGGFLDPSVRALERYYGTVYQGYGIASRHAAFSLSDAATLDPRMAFPALVEWVRKGCGG